MLYPKRTVTQQEHDVVVKWFPNGTTTACTFMCPEVASVNRTGTGAYRITLRQPARNIMDARHTLTSAAATAPIFVNRLIADGRVGNSGSAYVNVLHTVNGAAADIAAATGTIVTTTITICASKSVE